MGRPFDFATGKLLDAKPDAYDPKQYLTFASVANSLMHLFAVPAGCYWAVDRNGPPAALLTPGAGPFTA